MKLTQKLTHFIYSFVFFLYKRMMCFCIKEIDDVWIRNSFVLNYWSFGRSDIDITISVPALNNELGFKIAKSHSRLTSVLKIIGELCIVSKAPLALSHIAGCMNTYELLRDPLLCKLIPPAVPSNNEKIVFIHKFILANWLHDHKGVVRQQKLDFVFDFLGIHSSIKNFQSLKMELGNLVGTPFNSSIDQTYRAVVDEKIGPDLQCAPPYLALLFNKLYTYARDDLAFTEQERDILYLTIKWEIWGAYTNRFFNGFYNCNEHMGRLLQRSMCHLQKERYFELVSLAITLDLLSAN